MHHSGRGVVCSVCSIPARRRAAVGDRGRRPHRSTTADGERRVSAAAPC